jgi:collagen type III alpha
MAGRARDASALDDAPGPGEYAKELDAVTKDGSSGPSYTFGRRHANDGAMGNMKEKAAMPGPGAYRVHDADDDAADDAAGGSGRRRKRPKPKRGYTIATRTKDPATIGDARGGPDWPGPGEYHDSDRIAADAEGGRTMGARLPAAGTDATPGKEGPGPAMYGGYTTADLEVGTEWSMGERLETGGVFANAMGEDAPGPGYYAPEVFQWPVGKVVPWKQVGFTIRPRRDDDGGGGGRSPGPPTPGPGYYEPDTSTLEADARAKTPPWRMKGVSVKTREGWEKAAARERKSDAPAPTDYDPTPPNGRSPGGPAHTIGVRRGPSARRAAAARRNPSPGPGAYENGPRPIGASNVAKLQKGVVLGARPPDRKAAADADAPAPGEYYPDGDGDDARKKTSSRGPNLGRATGHDAPGGALDAATRAGRTPGPGEFYDETTDARRRARGRATTISRTAHDAYGGFMDVARRGGETPGPGEFYSAGGRRGTTPVRIGRTTGHDAPGGAIRRVLYTGPHTTAFAW